MSIRRHWSYLQYVLRHKWYVAFYGWKIKLPIWILIFHDWDKFLPDEWFPYAKTFYKANGESRYKETDAFNTAWLLHQNRNKHHWQFWMLINDSDGKPVCLPMPDVYRREMLADWRGAGHAINGKDDTASWYKDNYDNIQLHPETRKWVNIQLRVAKKEGEVIYVA